MPRFNVSVDILLPVLVEVDATDEEDAIDRVLAMAGGELLSLANKEEIEVLEGSEWVDPA